jgi:hypothetical protein
MFDRPCDEVLAQVTLALQQAGFRVQWTFDLQVARSAMKGHSCQCPHHGTTHCDCQYFVLLVYEAASSPVTLVLHGYDGRSWADIADSSRIAANAALAASVARVLQNHTFA